MPATLVDRIAKHTQKQARLDQAGARLKMQLKKARTRNLISAGALVEKAGMLKFDEPTMLGAFLSLETAARDTKTIAGWRKAGRKALAGEPAEESAAADDAAVSEIQAAAE